MSPAADEFEFRTPAAYGFSLLLHGGIVALIFGLGFFFSQSSHDQPKVFELVAGAGDNYMGTEATALGKEDGIKFDPAQAAVRPTPPAPEPVAAPEPEPATAAPLEPVAPPPPKPVTARATAKPTKTAPAKPTARTFEQAVKWGQIKAESAAKMRAAREKRAQEKAARLAKAKETYEQYMAEQGEGSAKGRRTGVAKGTTMADGAGGKALTATQQDALAAWTQLLRSRWLENWVPPTDFNDSMTAHVKWFVAADGTISNIRVTHSNGNAAFEEAVVEALRRVRVPPPPIHRGQDYELDFSLKNEE